MYTGETALCVGSRCNIQNVEPREEGTEGGDPLRSKVANKLEKKKDGKRFLTQEAFFFANTMQTGNWRALREPP